METTATFTKEFLFDIIVNIGIKHTFSDRNHKLLPFLSTKLIVFKFCRISKMLHFDAFTHYALYSISRSIHIPGYATFDVNWLWICIVNFGFLLNIWVIQNIKSREMIHFHDYFQLFSVSGEVNEGKVGQVAKVTPTLGLLWPPTSCSRRAVNIGSRSKLCSLQIHLYIPSIYIT